MQENLVLRARSDQRLQRWLGGMVGKVLRGNYPTAEVCSRPRRRDGLLIVTARGEGRPYSGLHSWLRSKDHALNSMQKPTPWRCAAEREETEARGYVRFSAD
jgi:hypothetical protein